MVIDLSTFTADELWVELRSRFNVAVLCYERDGKKKDATHNGVWWEGTHGAALGALRWGEIHMDEILRQSIRSGATDMDYDPNEDDDN